MKYSEWIETVPMEIREDAVWSMQAYRLALFVAEIGWHDATKLYKDRRTRGLSEQLFDALGSIGANISEGYSRSSAKDRCRFYEYALGSARESRTWYFNGRFMLGGPVAEHRIKLVTHIIKLLATMVPATRGYSLHEGDTVSTQAFGDDGHASRPSPELHELIENVRIP